MSFICFWSQMRNGALEIDDCFDCCAKMKATKALQQVIERADKRNVLERELPDTTFHNKSTWK